MLNKRKQELKNIEYELKMEMLNTIKEKNGKLTLNDYDKVMIEVERQMKDLYKKRNVKKDVVKIAALVITLVAVKKCVKNNVILKTAIKEANDVFNIYIKNGCPVNEALFTADLVLENDFMFSKLLKNSLQWISGATIINVINKKMNKAN